MTKKIINVKSLSELVDIYNKYQRNGMIIELESTAFYPPHFGPRHLIPLTNPHPPQSTAHPNPGGLCQPIIAFNKESVASTGSKSPRYLFILTTKTIPQFGRLKRTLKLL